MAAKPTAKSLQTDDSPQTAKVSSTAEDSTKTPTVEGMLQKLSRREQEAKARIANQKAEELSVTHAKAAEKRALDLKRHHASNTTVQKRTAAVNAEMHRLEGQGLFVSFPIAPQNKFPTLLTRIPLFRSSRRKKQSSMADIDTALAFDTPFGAGKRYGPPLTVKDEDILIALMRLRSKRLVGKPHQLPAGVADIYRTNSNSGSVAVHCTVCSVSDVLAELELTDAGLNYKDTLQSIKRLGATTLELNLNKQEKYLGLVQTGRMIPLIHVQWQTWETDGLLVVVFPPVIAQWLDQEYTYIDWSIRRQLDDLGKCLHRFLSGQKPIYQRKIVEIGKTIGYDGPKKNIRQRFTKSLQRMVEVGWLDSFEFRGSARSDTNPLTLHTKKVVKLPKDGKPPK